MAISVVYRSFWFGSLLGSGMGLPRIISTISIQRVPEPSRKGVGVRSTPCTFEGISIFSHVTFLDNPIISLDEDFSPDKANKDVTGIGRALLISLVRRRIKKRRNLSIAEVKLNYTFFLTHFACRRGEEKDKNPTKKLEVLKM